MKSERVIDIPCRVCGEMLHLRGEITMTADPDDRSKVNAEFLASKESTREVEDHMKGHHEQVG